VKRVLRSRVTGRYFSRERWSEDLTGAQPFEDTEAALRACVSNDLRDVGLVLRHPTSGAELFATRMR